MEDEQSLLTYLAHDAELGSAQSGQCSDVAAHPILVYQDTSTIHQAAGTPRTEERSLNASNFR